MNHPHEDRLLLLAYGELPETEARQLETHVAACAVCRDDLERLERARVALDWGGAAPRRRSRAARWIAAGLAAAAVLAAVLLGSHTPPPQAQGAWQPSHVWSATAGYIAGGPPLVQIDAQLTRLEQERYHGLPN
jgi:anti-sigma factor RsiW